MKTHDGRFTLAIDLGTSGPKVALVSPDGKIRAHAFEATPLQLLPGGGAEQNPDDWWRAVVTATRRLLARAQVDGSDVATISCTAQWSGTVAVDEHGQHLHNAIIWMDSRGASHVKRLTGGPLSIQGYGVGKLWTWLRLTGGIPAHSGKDAIAHILWLKHERPEIYHRTYKFLEPKDYLNLRLTGRFATSIDAIALHWVTDNRDIDRVIYSHRLLRMIGIDGAKLPDLKRATDVLGALCPQAAAELGLSTDTRVIVGTPDVQSAAVGSGAVRDYAGHLYLGTSAWITCHVPFKKTDLSHNMASLPSAIPGRYFIANEQETAGACLSFLHKMLCPETEIDTALAYFNTRAASVSAGSDRIIFTPWLYGERTPVEDHSVRGGFHNLSLRTTQDHLIRAVFEGVAFNARWLLNAVERFIKRRMHGLNVVGGGAQSDLWCQIHADILDRPIHQVVDPIRANLRGAGLLASVAQGYLSTDELDDRVEIDRIYEPNPVHRAVYDDLFAEFCNLYKQNRAIYARLNRASFAELVHPIGREASHV